MQRALVAGFPAERAMKLELQDVREEIPRIRNVRGDMILRPGIEIRFATRDGRRTP